MCKDDTATCKLHPKKGFGEEDFSDFDYEFEGDEDGVPPWQWIIDLIKKFADDHMPLFDLDEDGFSDFPSFRGYHWRG